jgi:spore maturation protein CgeB
MLFRALVSAFIRQGWYVTFVEEYHPWLETHTDFAFEHPNLQVLCYTDRQSLVELLNKSACFEGSQLVLKFSGSSSLHDRYLDEWLAEQRKVSARPFFLVYVDADAPMRLPYIVRHPRFYLHAVLPCFDGVWVMLGGQRAVDEYCAIGARQAWFLPAAIDIEAFQPKPPTEEYAADLLFIGNPTYGRNQMLKQLFFDVAEQCPAERFLLAGAEWESIPLPHNISYLGYVPSTRLPELYSSARLVLNVTREEMAVYGHAAALRLFEAAICGACIVSDTWQGLDTIFVPGKEILLVEDTEDVVRYMKTIDKSQAYTIGQYARSRVLVDHTGDIRVDNFLSCIAMK